MDQETYNNKQNELVQQLKQDGNENLARIIDDSSPEQLANQDKMDGLEEAFPEQRSILISASANAIEKRKEEGGYSVLDYFDDNIHGNLDFQPLKMVEELIEKFRFKSVENRGLYVWRDDIWQKVEKNNQGFISQEINKRLRNETKQKYRNNVKDIIRGREEIKVTPEEFQNPKLLLPFKNGVYDLEEDELKEHKPQYNFTFKYKASYRPELEADGVNQLIQDIAPESSSKRKKIKEILGIGIAPWKVNQKVPILHGKGANGKNQLVKAGFKIVGKKNYHKTDAHSLQNDKFETASLLDKQLAFFDEFEDASKPGKLKGIVGDDEQKVREMQKESYTVKTSVYGIFAANQLPNANDNSDGFYRRWEIIDFNQRFTDEEGDGNPNKLKPWELEEKYMSEDDIDAFATSLVQHLKDVIDRGKIKNQATTEETRRTWNLKSGNAVFTFIDKYLTQGDYSFDGESDSFNQNDWIAKTDLQDIVNDYMDHHNNSQIRKDQLTRALKAHPDINVDCDYRPRTDEGGRVMAYGGIKLDPGVVNDVNAISTSSRTHTRGSLAKANIRYWVDMVDQPPVSEAILYLLTNDNATTPLFDLVKGADLDHSEIATVNDSELVNVTHTEQDGVSFPEYSINQEKVEKLKEQAEEKNNNSRNIVDTVAELDQGEGVPLDDVVDELDLNEAAVEKKIEEHKNEGRIFEPEPGKLKEL